MKRFFKIVFPDGKSLFVKSNNGYTGLIGLIDGIQDKENTYIVTISLFEFIKEVLS